MSPSAEILKLISKPLSKAPGWAPLGLAAMWFMNSELPRQLAEEHFGLENLALTQTAWVLGLTLVFYKIGDWLDELVFKRRISLQEENTNGSFTESNSEGGQGSRTTEAPRSKTSKRNRITCPRFDPQYVVVERDAARSILGVQDGSYRVAAALLKAAGKLNGVTIANEAAKFLRSLVVPFFLAAIFGFWVTTLSGRAWLLGGAVFALFAYVLLKLFHIWLLYHRARGLPNHGDHYKRLELRNDYVVFLWDGTAVADADPTRPDQCPERTNQY